MNFKYHSLFSPELMEPLESFLSKLYKGGICASHRFWDMYDEKCNLAWKKGDFTQYNLLLFLGDWVNGKIRIELSKNSKVRDSVAKAQGIKIQIAEKAFEKALLDIPN